MKLSSITMVLVAAIIFSFSGKGYAQVKKKAVPIAKSAKAAKITPAEISEAKGLMAKSDCMACHKLDVKVVGPAYVDVAKKYPATEANYALLSKKVINGGSGVWGALPMSPHSTLPAADAKKMVKYILSLN